MIGIDEHANLYYQGSPSGGAIALWPPPLFSTATVVRQPGDEAKVPSSVNLAFAPLLFREDHFDPVTRLRRGRFYSAGDGSRSELWSVYPHPAMSTEYRHVGQGGYVRKTLLSFFEWSTATNLVETSTPLSVVLGTSAAMTRWRVLSVERISTGEDLVTLKARSNMGVLPEIAESQVPPEHKSAIVQFTSNVVDIVYRGGPESVIDRCRDLASVILGVVLSAPDKDLAKLAMIAKDSNRHLLSHVANILAIMHARAKPAEQARRGVKHPGEEDAALAIECAATILREVGWARP